MTVRETPEPLNKLTPGIYVYLRFFMPRFIPGRLCCYSAPPSVLCPERPSAAPISVERPAKGQLHLQTADRPPGRYLSDAFRFGIPLNTEIDAILVADRDRPSTSSSRLNFGIPTCPLPRRRRTIVAEETPPRSKARLKPSRSEQSRLRSRLPFRRWPRASHRCPPPSSPTQLWCQP